MVVIRVAYHIPLISDSTVSVSLYSAIGKLGKITWDKNLMMRTWVFLKFGEASSGLLSDLFVNERAVVLFLPEEGEFFKNVTANM